LVRRVVTIAYPTRQLQFHVREVTTHSTRASLAGVPLTCKHLVLSLLGLIARPVIAGVEEVDEADEEVLEEVDDVEEAEEEADEVVVPALSCLIKSAARSA
jgi:hypothetical protein